jgi:hypothetical protein
LDAAMPNASQRRIVRAGLLITTVGLCLVVVADGARSSAVLPSTITPWHAIGGIGIGSSTAAIRYRYGREGKSGVIRFTRPDGTLDVSFNKGHVGVLTTTSPYFRTPTGIGVGSRIPLGPCHSVGGGNCTYLWQGFKYSELHGTPRLIGSWTKRLRWAGRNLSVSLLIRPGGTISTILITEEGALEND